MFSTPKSSCLFFKPINTRSLGTADFEHPLALTTGSWHQSVHKNPACQLKAIIFFKQDNLLNRLSLKSIKNNCKNTFLCLLFLRSEATDVTETAMLETLPNIYYPSLKTWRYLLGYQFLTAVGGNGYPHCGRHPCFSLGIYIVNSVCYATDLVHYKPMLPQCR